LSLLPCIPTFFGEEEIPTMSYLLDLPDITRQILAFSEPQNWAVRPLFHFHRINSTECNRKCQSHAKRGLPEVLLAMAGWLGQVGH